MKFKSSQILDIIRWFKSLLRQSASLEMRDKDKIFTLELYRLLLTYEFIPEEKLLLTADEQGTFQGERGFVDLFNQAIHLSEIHTERFPASLALRMDSAGEITPFTPLSGVVKLQKSMHLPHARPQKESESWHHSVQFYENKPFICDQATHFLLPALRNKGGAIIAATPEHRELLEQTFRDNGILVDQLKKEGSLIFLDAAEILSLVMVNGMPIPEKFDAVIRALIVDMNRKYTIVRAYADLVNLLCEKGNSEGAIELEKLCNNVMKEYSSTFTLMCGYNMNSFRNTSDNIAFQHLCELHTAVIPTEQYLEVSPRDQPRIIVELQQKAKALETEVHSREEIVVLRTQELRRTHETLQLETQVRLQIEKQMVQQEMELELALQARVGQEELMATICHDVRNPLHVMYGVVDFLKDRCVEMEDILNEKGGKLDRETVSKFQDILERIKENANSLELCSDQQMAVLGDALDLSKLNNTKLELHPVIFLVQHTFTNIINMYRPQFDQKRIKKTLALPEGEIWLRSDVNRLTRVMSNLISNALKFTPEEGSINICVTHETIAKDAANLSIFVKDTGIGIKPTALKKIFNPYVQASKKTSSEYGGTGLGLVICKKIVEGMGGSISVESEKGVGSKFSFNIICDKLSPDKKLITADKQPFPQNNLTEDISLQPRVSALLDHTVILILEENVISQNLLSFYLQGIDCVFHIANNSEELLELHEKFTFDLILINFEVLKINGAETLSIIRERESNSGKRSVIIGFTANAMEKNSLAPLLDIDGYLTKPLHKDEFYEKIITSILKAQKTSESKSESKSDLPSHTSSQKLMLFGHTSPDLRKAKTEILSADETSILEIDTNIMNP